MKQHKNGNGGNGSNTKKEEKHKNLGGHNKFTGLEAIQVNCRAVNLVSDEVTALCPVTGQPDQYTVRISIFGGASIESKSLKLYFQTFRNKGIFCEDFAGTIKADVIKAIKAGKDEASVFVTVTQKARGGISILAEA